jgi:hypothetical protein
MRQIAAVLGLCALLLPMTAWADGIVLTNQGGTVSVSNAGIVSGGSELVGFKIINGFSAPPGQSLGSVSFSTGALTSGSVLGGGVFSSTDSSFIVNGSGMYGVPKGTIFSGSFVRDIYWTLVSHPGNNEFFDLGGEVSGMLYSGRIVSGYTTQVIYVNQNQFNHDQQGSIRTSRSRVGFGPPLAGPEPSTLWTFATGLIVIAGAMRRKLFRA